MADGSRTCPAPGCGRRLPRERFACRTHWFALRPRTRREVGDAWHAFLYQGRPALSLLLAAQRRAVAELERKGAA